VALKIAINSLSVELSGDMFFKNAKPLTPKGGLIVFC